ncbi:LuxR C-terminal-related transcriptional regulator [Kitasatospora sp. NPDC059571]|uniref:LuxR C-terminal-related transcriptional regulator n=1 Tax=Kitasatospora sp. NPDC059571 TaxID=3346871 RepID=UPI0036B5904C
MERAAADGRPYDVVLVDADLGPHPTAADAARRGPARPARADHGAPPRALAVLPHQRREGAAGRPARTPAPPFADGITLTARVCRSHPALRAVVLATADDPQRAVRALQAGAAGWVARESSLARLMTVIRGVLRDETHLPPALLTGVVRELTSARRDRTESERLVGTLTPREEEVLRCMVAGLGRQAVAERLYLSPHTVRTHMQNVLGKLGVHSTLAAVAVARRAGLTPSDPPLPEPLPQPPADVADPPTAEAPVAGPPAAAARSGAPHPAVHTRTVATTAGPGAG